MEPCERLQIDISIGRPTGDLSILRNDQSARGSFSLWMTFSPLHTCTNMHTYIHSLSHTLSPRCSERALLCEPEEMQTQQRTGHPLIWVQTPLILSLSSPFSLAAIPHCLCLFFPPSSTPCFLCSLCYLDFTLLHIVFVSLWSTTPHPPISATSLTFSTCIW